MDKATLAACQDAAKQVHDGAVVAYPSEAVYGLGCDPWQEKAVQKILDLKQRPRNKGLIVLASSWQTCKQHIQPLPKDRLHTMLASWPGPHTWLLPNKDFPAWITGNHNTVAIRVTAHPVAAKLCELAGGLLVSTSANQTGKTEMRSATDIQSLWGTQLAAIIEGETGDLEKPTTIQDALSGKMIRPG